MMNLFFLILSVFIDHVSVARSQCTPIGSSCTEDCECCGYGQSPSPTKCERRVRALGFQCYVSIGGGGGKCTQDADCRSQHCLNGECKPIYNPPPAAKCPIQPSDTLPVSGTYIGGCLGAPPPPNHVDALKATDGDLNTYYVNYLSQMGGLSVELSSPNYSSLRAIKICNSACTHCDPATYILEGTCTSTNQIITLQAGDVGFTTPNECVTIPVTGSFGPQLYTKYTLKFPTQKGMCRETCGIETFAVSCPLQLAEVEFLANCALL